MADTLIKTVKISKKYVDSEDEESEDEVAEEINTKIAKKVLDPLEDMVTITASADKLNPSLVAGKIIPKLYQHQLESVQRMMDIEDNKHEKNFFFNTGYGVLSDPVGSGKTLEVLSLIAARTTLTPPVNQVIVNKYIEYIAKPRIIYEKKRESSYNTSYLFNSPDTIASQLNPIYGDTNYYSSFRMYKSMMTYDAAMKMPFELVKTNIIVVPHNVVNQWKNAVETQTKLKNLVVNKTVNIPEHFTEFGNYDVVIISLTRFEQVMERYMTNILTDKKQYYVYRFIVDEAHTFRSKYQIDVAGDKTTGTHNTIKGHFKINSIFIWWMTSSFKSLFTLSNISANTITPIQSLYNQSKDDHCSDIVKFITVKHSQEEINDSIKLPPKYAFVVESTIEKLWQNVISNFKSLVTSDAIHAMNAGDYGAVIDRLGIEEVTPENLLASLTQKMQDDIDNSKLMLEAKKNMKYSTENAKQKALEHLAHEIASKESRLESIIKSINGENECPVCFCELDENKALLKCCYKKTCLECLISYFTNKYECPSCAEPKPQYIALGDKNKAGKASEETIEDSEGKKAICDNDMLYLKSLNIKTSKTDKTNSDKILMSLNNTENNKAHHFENIMTYLNNYVDKASILVFSKFDGTFKNCISVFAKIGILNKEIKGTPDQIKNIVSDYESNKVKVLMLNSANMGFGMNLQTTTDIIIMHKMDSETEKQVVGRAYRIGRKSPLRVWYIYNNTEM